MKISTGGTHDEPQTSPRSRWTVRLPTNPAYTLTAVVAVALAFVPAFSSRYGLALASLALLAAIRAIGLTIMVGWTGQFAFISVVFFGIGAYTGALLDSRVGVSVELVIIAAAAMGLASGALLGAMVARLRRYYLTIATTAFLFIVDFAWRNWTTVTGGVRGITVDEPYLWTTGQVVTTETGKYYVSLILLVIVFTVAVRLRTTQLARGWVVIRQNEDIAAALGINIIRSKVAAFAICASMCAVAGAWFTYLDNHIFPASFTFELQIIDVIVVIVGGLGSLRGAVLAGSLLIILREYVRTFVGLSELVFGAALLLCVLFLPKGVYGEIAARYRGLRERML